MTRIFITGDTHGLHDTIKIDRFNTLMGKELSKDDYLIIAGDAGMCWIGDPSKDLSLRKNIENNAKAKLEEYRKIRPDKDLSEFESYLKSEVESVLTHDRYVQDFWDKMPWTTLFIDGNHDNHAILDSYPVINWHGGKAHKITDSIIHLMRGQVYDIGGTTFFTFGGAESTDKEYRTENISWWARELPSEAEYEEALSNLDKHNGKVDYILTHCGPEHFLTSSGMPHMYYRSQNDLVRFFDAMVLSSTLDYKKWYFGHYHDDCDFKKFHLLFDNISEIELNHTVTMFDESVCCSDEIRHIWEEKTLQDKEQYPKTIEITGLDSVMTMHYFKKEIADLLFRVPGDGVSFAGDILYVKVNNTIEENLLLQKKPLYEGGKWYSLLDSCPGDDYSVLKAAVNAVLGRTAGFSYKDSAYCVYATDEEYENIMNNPAVKRSIEQINENRIR